MLGRRGRRRCPHRFRDLRLPQQIGVVAVASVQLALLLAAEVDIQRRSADQVVGRKLWWRAICLINFLGPISYFRWGRRQAIRYQPAPAPASVGPGRLEVASR
jgi:hypothetical protein